jgi:membrane-associated phospholipid phosphatase
MSQSARSIFNSNWLFFILLCLFYLAGGLFLLLTSHSQGFLDLRTVQSPGLDIFFLYYTNLGNGWFSVALGLAILIFRFYRRGGEVLIAWAVSGLLAQLIKHLVNSPRPKEFFRLREHIYLINGTALGGNESFPSGHSASAFALATLMALHSKNKSLSLLYFAGAALVAYSRVYLAEHFPADVLAGSLIGVLCALATYSVFDKVQSRRKRVRSEE